MRKNKLLLLLALLLMVATGAWAQDYYAPSTDEVIILNDVYDDSKSGYSSHSAIAWGGSASASQKKAGDPNNGGQPTSSDVNCYSVKGNGAGKNITLSITGVSKVIVYYHRENSRYIELRDGSKNGNIIGSGEISTYYTEVELTATKQYSIFLHGTSDGSNDQDLYVYAIKLIAAPASTYSVTLAEGTEDFDKWTISPAEAAEGSPVTATYSGEKKVKSVKAVKKAAVPVTAITLNKTATEIKVGSTETLSVTAVAPENATDKTYTWKTSDASKATVDQDGKVTAVAVGTVTIYAEANDGSGVKGSCTVTVTPVTVTWNSPNFNSNPYTRDGVTLTGNASGNNFYNNGDKTFTNTLGKFTKIEIVCEGNNFNGWAKEQVGEYEPAPYDNPGWKVQVYKLTWTGNAESVTIPGGNYLYGIQSITFTIQ